MIGGVKLALLGASLIALAACAAPDRQADLDNIAANLEQTREGDFGAFLYDLSEAGDKARRAEAIYDELAQVPPSTHVSLIRREEGVRLAEESAEHRRRAEDALNRMLEPLLAQNVAFASPRQTVPAMTRSVRFAAGSAAIDEDGQAALDALAAFISQHPGATVTITAYADSEDMLEANRASAERRAQAVARALRGLGGPSAGSVSVVAAAGPERAAASGVNPERRHVEVLVAPQGTY